MMYYYYSRMFDFSRFFYHKIYKLHSPLVFDFQTFIFMDKRLLFFFLKKQHALFNFDPVLIVKTKSLVCKFVV